MGLADARYVCGEVVAAIREWDDIFGWAAAAEGHFADLWHDGLSFLEATKT